VQDDCLTNISPKNAGRPRRSRRGWIGVGRAGLDAQAANQTQVLPEPSMGEGNTAVEAPSFRAGRTSTAWLQAHPGVRVVARDRAEAYGAGIRQGAPDATQVADRFHLMQNLADALEQVVSAHSKDLEVMDEKRRQEPVACEDGSLAAPVPPPKNWPGSGGPDAWLPLTRCGRYASKGGRANRSPTTSASASRRCLTIYAALRFPSARGAATGENGACSRATKRIC